MIYYIKEIINYVKLCERVNYSYLFVNSMGSLPKPQNNHQQNELKQMINKAEADLQEFKTCINSSEHQLKITKIIQANQFIHGFIYSGITQKVKEITKSFSQSLLDGVINSLSVVAGNVMGVGRASETKRKFYTTFRDGRGYFRLDIFFTTKSMSAQKSGMVNSKQIMGTYYRLAALEYTKLTDNEKQCIKVIGRPNEKEAPIKFKQPQIKNQIKKE